MANNEDRKAKGDDTAASGDNKRTSKETPRSLGAFIRAQRELANLSLRQVASMAEVSNAYLSQIERDLHEPSLRVLNNVGKALGINVEDLMAKAGFSQSGKKKDTPAAVTTEDAIKADPKLSAGEKQALLSVYRSYISSEAE